MALRITHTNNSNGHGGTYVYRSASPMDPQNLPAPIVDAPPVALGATFEYIDNDNLSGDQYYRTQDHEDGQVSAVSAEVMISLAEDFSTAQVGDEIGGGIYAGIITYADTRQFHIVAAKESGEAIGLAWGNSGTTTGASNPDDGLANQNLILTSFDNGTAEVFYYCRDYTAGGNADWYLPTTNEMLLVMNNLVASNHPEFSIRTTQYRMTSRESAAYPGSNIQLGRWNDQTISSNGAPKTSSNHYARPIRRVPV